MIPQYLQRFIYNTDSLGWNYLNLGESTFRFKLPFFNREIVLHHYPPSYQPVYRAKDTQDLARWLEINCFNFKKPRVLTRDEVNSLVAKYKRVSEQLFEYFTKSNDQIRYRNELDKFEKFIAPCTEWSVGYWVIDNEFEKFYPELARIVREYHENNRT